MAFKISAFLPYQLAVLAERVSRRLSVEYDRSHGLSVAEWRVLVHLRDNGQISVRDITNRVNLDKPRVSRTVARLEKSGMVKKYAGTDDGRLISVSLTPKGEAALTEIVPLACAVEERLLAALSAQERRQLDEIMEKLHKVLDVDPDARARSPIPEPDVNKGETLQ